MARTIFSTYDDYERAAQVVSELEAAGLPAEDISIIGRRLDEIEHDAADGAQAGGMIGSGAGLLGALVALPIPGVGPVLAAGWIIGGTALGAVAGAAAGSLIGALTGAGASEAEANLYAETLRRGGAVVAVRAPESRAALVQAIMQAGGPIDETTRRADYQKEGWTRFDERDGNDRRPEDLSRVVS